VITRRPALREDRDRTHLDPAKLRGDHSGDLDRLVEVVGLDQVEAAERFLGLDERAIGDNVAADRGRGVGALQGVAPGDLAAARDDLLGEAVVGIHNLAIALGREGRVVGLVFVDEDHVLSHGVLLWLSGSDILTTNRHGHNRHFCPVISARQPPDPRLSLGAPSTTPPIDPARARCTQTSQHEPVSWYPDE